MEERPVIFLDSGIGGIPYCQHFIKRNPAESVFYVADRQNFPYGPRNQGEIVTILTSLTEKLVETFNPKIAVIACNTASVSALGNLRAHFQGISFVGTVPAVKPASHECRSGKVGVIATERTIADPYVARLLGGDYEICGIAAPDLVDFVEQRLAVADEKEKRDIVKKYIQRFRGEGVDCIVLACTHFLFLKEEFQQEAIPDIKVFDSLDGVTRRIESLLDENDGALRATSKVSEQNTFFVTGSESADESWQSWADRLGFRLSAFIAA